MKDECIAYTTAEVSKPGIIGAPPSKPPPAPGTMCFECKTKQATYWAAGSVPTCPDCMPF